MQAAGMACVLINPESRYSEAIVKTVHVCLVSDQPMANVTSIMQLEPDHVEMLFTRDKLEQGKRMEEFLTGRNISVRGTEIQPFDMQAVMASCRRIIDEYADCELSLNITGGTKISALGCFQVFSKLASRSTMLTAITAS